MVGGRNRKVSEKAELVIDKISLLPKIDSAILTMMLFEDMNIYKGGKIYSGMILKPSS